MQIGAARSRLPRRVTLVMYSGVSGLGGEMARSRQGACDPPVAITAQGGSGQAPRPGTAGRGSKAVWGLVALGVVHQTLRSRRFQEGMGLAVIALGALRGIGQDNRASTTARLSAWDKRQIQRLQLQAERQALRIEHKAERHARTVRGARQMARSGPPSVPVLRCVSSSGRCGR
jgi:hypothetical protein